MKLRQHRGGLAESMATTIEIEPTMESLLEAVRASMAPLSVADNSLSVKHYGFDERIDWDTYIVEIQGFGIYGFTDGPIN